MCLDRQAEAQSHVDELQKCVGREGPDKSIAMLSYEGLLDMAFEGATSTLLS